MTSTDQQRHRALTAAALTAALSLVGLVYTDRWPGLWVILLAVTLVQVAYWAWIGRPGTRGSASTSARSSTGKSGCVPGSR
ncbi:hypothetical protein GCM10023162_11630 [Klenkia terrae]